MAQPPRGTEDHGQDDARDHFEHGRNLEEIPNPGISDA
jgi:hypothetical protein